MPKKTVKKSSPKKVSKKVQNQNKNQKSKSVPSVKRGAIGEVRTAVNESGMRPLGDRIVVRALSENEMGTRSASGIIIPDTVSKEKPEQGIVIAVGPGRIGDDNERVPMSVKAGDRILFSKYGFDEVKVGGNEYFIVSETGVLAIIKE